MKHLFNLFETLTYFYDVLLNLLLFLLGGFIFIFCLKNNVYLSI